MTKHISGTWFEFFHANLNESTHINDACKSFTAEQWREKVREIRGTGQEYLVIGNVGSETENFEKLGTTEAFYETDLRPHYAMACKNPLEPVMDEAAKCGMKVFMASGSFSDIYGNMQKPGEQEVEFKAMGELVEKFGHHKSFYGWYFPYEAWINDKFNDEYIDYINKYCDVAKSLNKDYKTLIAPFGTCNPKSEDAFTKQLEHFDVDIIAYQDEVGVCKATVDELPRIYEVLKRCHDKAGRSALWADAEIFAFEGEPYKTALIPAPSSRVIGQLEAISPYVDKILVYQYQGMMSKPGGSAFVGVESAGKLYTDYMDWMRANHADKLPG